MDWKDLKYILLTLIWMAIFILTPIIPLLYFTPKELENILIAFVYAVGIECVLVLLFFKFVDWHNKRIEKKHKKKSGLYCI